MDFLELLERLSVPNRDNGVRFTETDRFDAINALLWNSRYRRINPDGLFFLYAAKPLDEICDPVLISSHIDCVMPRLFSREQDQDLLLGTYDNSITNAGILWLMLENALPDNVLVAFTGDEERSSHGAAQLVRYLTDQNKKPAVTLVLDVTDMGWEDGADFTVENNFWSDGLGHRVVGAAEATGACWKFVPSDVDEIPSFVEPSLVIAEEATEDESWEYDEYDWNCFSLCLPVDGPMHSSAGVLARKAGVQAYIQALRNITIALSGNANK